MAKSCLKNQSQGSDHQQHHIRQCSIRKQQGHSFFLELCSAWQPCLLQNTTDICWSARWHSCILLGLCHICNPRLLIIVFLVRSSGTRKDRNGTHTTRDSCILYGWSGIRSCIKSFDFDCWWILLRMLRCWSVLAAYTDCYEHGTTAWHAQNGTKSTKAYLDAKLSAALEKSKILINIVSPPHMQLLVRCNYYVIYDTQQLVTASQTIRV